MAQNVGDELHARTVWFEGCERVPSLVATTDSEDPDTVWVDVREVWMHMEGNNDAGPRFGVLSWAYRIVLGPVAVPWPTSVEQIASHFPQVESHHFDTFVHHVEQTRRVRESFRRLRERRQG